MEIIYIKRYFNKFIDCIHIYCYLRKTRYEIFKLHPEIIEKQFFLKPIISNGKKYF